MAAPGRANNNIAMLSEPPAEGCTLLSIPPELRNEIYELAFTAGGEDDVVDLFDAKPPSKDLLLTCRPIANEATAIYQDAYRKFWMESRFVIKSPKLARKSLDSLTEGILRHIKELTIYRFEDANVQFILEDGVWKNLYYGREPNEKYFLDSSGGAAALEGPEVRSMKVHSDMIRNGVCWYRFRAIDAASDRVKMLKEYAKLQSMSKDVLWCVLGLCY